MTCLKCKSDSPDATTFRVLEVHTLHIRDFNGERIIQTLGELRSYEICTACTLEGVRAFLYPAGMIAVKCLPFMVLAVIGAVLSFALTLNAEMMIALRVIGPIAVFAGVSGVIGRVRDILRVRDELRNMNHDEAMRYSAYTLLLENAPKKYNDNDITYIPVNNETQSMTPSQLAGKYNLLPAISTKAHEIMLKEGEING